MYHEFTGVNKSREGFLSMGPDDLTLLNNSMVLKDILSGKMIKVIR